MSSFFSSEQQIRDLTQGSISKKLFSLTLPLMAVSFIQMTYNFIDIAWVGRLGSRSSAAVGTMGLFMWLMSSIALISKIGAEITIGQSIGARRQDKASMYASHTTMIAILLGLFFFLVFVSQTRLIVSFFGLEEDITYEAVNYLRIVAFGFPAMFLILNFSGIYVGTGRSDIPFYFMAFGLVLNIVLDPVLIFGLWIFPKMGLQGAALATVISQISVIIFYIWHLKKFRLLGRFSFFIRLRRHYTLHILKLGVPFASMHVLFSFISMNLVRIAFTYGGHLGVTSQTIGGQIEGITYNTSSAFSTSLGSFVAQNYAAERIDRAKRAFRYTWKIMAVLGTLVTLAFFFFGDKIFSVFIPEEAAYRAGGEYLAILGVSQLFMMLEIITGGMFNGFGRTTPPAIISIVFNVLRIPAAIFLASRMGVIGVWWAVSISSIFKGILLFIWYILFSKKVEKK